MRVARSWAALGALALIGWIGSATIVEAAPITFTTELSGARQVPPVKTSGHGTADLTYDPSTRVLTWDITYSGLSSPATMAHIHGPATASKNAGIQIWLSKRGNAPISPIKGEATLSETQAKMLMADEMYVNVHSKNHPAGEIRGQIEPPKS